MMPLISSNTRWLRTALFGHSFDWGFGAFSGDEVLVLGYPVCVRTSQQNGRALFIAYLNTSFTHHDFGSTSTGTRVTKITESNRVALSSSKPIFY